LPDHVPFVVFRRWPDTAWPEIAGGTTFTGARVCASWRETTSCVAVERAAPLPYAFEAFTITRTREPRSRAFKTSVLPVAPRTRTHLPPDEAQSYQR